MNSKLIKTSIIICLLLIAVIMLEWFYATQAQEQLLNAISSPVQQTSTDEMPSIDLHAKPEGSYADLVDRPLFIAGRKPIPEAEPEQTTVVTNTTFDWRLSGVYSTPKGLMALLTRTIPKPPDPTGKTTVKNYKTVIVGGDVEGWKVAKINAAEIILNQGATEKKLPLRIPKEKKPLGQNSSTPPNPRAAPPAPITTPKAAPAPQAEPET